MTWQQKKWITIVLGVLTLFLAISGATALWLVVICGIAFLIGIASIVQHRRAGGRA
jgi:hypothetical protein